MRVNNCLCFCILILSFYSCEHEKIKNIEDTGTLPQVRILIDESYLWSADSGLYVIGINGKELCGPIANYNQKWEYPASVSYVNKGETLFNEQVGLRIKGGCSRVSSMKSLGLYWRKEYGSSRLEYPVFRNSAISSYKLLFLRNSSNDFGETQIKDISINSIVSDDANFEMQQYTQCVVYLNEEYWGIYNLREMITKHYFETHFGYEKENIDLLEGSEINPWADDGNPNNYKNTVVSFLQNNDLSLESNYIQIGNLIDVDSYIDYIIVNTYIGNRDWPQNNVKWWKDRTNNQSKWRWVLFDTDLSFELNRVERIWIGDLIGEPFNQNQASFFIFNKLLKNTQFKEIFLDRYLYFIEHVFDQNRVESMIRQTKNTIDAEYSNFHAKWNVLNQSQWENEIQKMISFNTQRQQIMKSVITHLRNEDN